MTDAELIRKVLRKAKEAESVREPWKEVWKDLSRLFLPYRARFLDEGDKQRSDLRNTWIYDSAGRLAVRTLASGMQSGLTSPSRPWFQLALKNDQLSDNPEAKAWLYDTEQRLFSVFSASNFYEQVHTAYSELAVFGTGCMLAEEDNERLVRFRTLTVGEYSLGTDAAGRVNALYRRIRMTPAQLVEAWPDTVPQQIKNLAGRDQQVKQDVIHCVEPREIFDGDSADGGQRPFASVYVLLSGQQTVLEHSGFYEFPALCPRWETTSSDIYGHSPAMDALSDNRMLQRMAKDGLEALELEVRPPLNVTAGGNEPLDISPAAVNYIASAMQGQQAITPLYQVRANLQALEATKEVVRAQIRDALFNNLFMMLANIDKSMTATEVAERNAEKMLMLGPVLDRMRAELFQPLITRVVAILNRQGMLAPVPAVMDGQQVEVEFISILAQAQKQAGLAPISQMVGMLGQLAQLDPTALDKLNTDETVDEVSDMLGVKPSLIRGAEEVGQIRQARAEQQQQMQQAAMAQQMADMADKGAGAMSKMAQSAESTGGMGGQQ